MNKRASEVTLKEEEVIFGPSDQLPQCLGNTWGYVRHCNRRTGTIGLYFKKRLIPVSICHLMLNSTLYISYSHMMQIPRCHIF